MLSRIDVVIVSGSGHGTGPPSKQPAIRLSKANALNDRDCDDLISVRWKHLIAWLLAQFEHLALRFFHSRQQGRQPWNSWCNQMIQINDFKN